MLQRYPHLEDIPDSVSAWDLKVRGAASLARTLKEHRDEALLFRELATLRTDAPIPQRDPEELRWRGVDRPAFEALAARLRSPRLLERLPPGAARYWLAHWPRRQPAAARQRLSGRLEQAQERLVVLRRGSHDADRLGGHADVEPGVAQLRGQVAPPSMAMTPAAQMSQVERPWYCT